MSEIDDEFNDIFDEFEEEENSNKSKDKKKATKKKITKKKTTKKVEKKKAPIKGRQMDYEGAHYFDTSICQGGCNKLKNNIAGQTGGCFECDNPDYKEEEASSDEDELLDFLEEEEKKSDKPKEEKKHTKPITNTGDKKKDLPRPRDRGELKSAQKSATELEIPEVEVMTVDDVREADTWFIYGEKSDGKTSFAMSFPGNILVLQFDEKAGVVWKEDFDGDPRISIIDITKILRSDDPILYLQTSTLALGYIEQVLDSFRDQNIDWVLIDGFESYASMAEMAMRFDQNIRYAEGVPQQTWKVRTLFMTQFHKRCLNVGKKGIIYTTYPFIQETIEFNGKQVKSKKPSWKKDSEKETDQLVYVYSEDDEKGTKFWIHLEKMKRGFYTGKRIDITTAKGSPREGYKLMMENASIKR